MPDDTEQKWTWDKPTKPGIYLTHLFNDDQGRPVVSTVLIVRHRTGRLWVQSEGSLESDDTYYGPWFGPIPVPPDGEHKKG